MPSITPTPNLSILRQPKRDVIDNFVVETEEFLEPYFDKEVNLVERIFEYNEMLADMKNKLRRIKKGLPLLR